MEHKQKGTVIFFKWSDDGSGYFGFVRPKGCTDMADNVRFVDSAVIGMSPALGDEVEFVVRRSSEGSRNNCASIRRI